MPDYNLAGLSPTSFEQLIQAIATKVIGPGTVIFGAGPDGAREATFEGKMQYPSLADPWDGYLVVQAKFLQRPQDTGRDGKWMVKQLDTELAKFAKRTRKLRKPEYYLLCTNAVLSSVQERGAKDRIETVFAKYSRDLRLKGYSVWDYDKLRSFIDDSADIRQAYLAWITPGDVLRRAMDWFEGAEPDFHQIVSTFLGSDVLDDRYARLDQAGHATQELTPISNLFIDLPVSVSPTDEPPSEEPSQLQSGFLRELLDAGAQKLDPTSLSLWVSGNRRGRGKREVPYGRFVLVGGPGQGKTTIGQFACQLYRTAILLDRPNLLPEVRDAITEIQRHCISEKLELPKGRRFPIRVVLNDFAKALADGVVTSLVEYVTKMIREKSNRDLTNEVLNRWLRLYPWLLVLDGLDEVPASSNRDAVIRAVTQFLGFANSAEADLLILATTRPQGYDADFSPEYYSHRYLTPLSVLRALFYGERLADITHGKDSTIAAEVKENLRSATETATTARLMRSPLQVTIMATLVARGGPAPQERWLLFRKYYNVIYDRETAKRIGEVTRILRTYRSHIDAIHYRVGLILQVESERTGRTDARLGTRDLSRIVRDRLQDEGLKGVAAEELERGIIDAASNRLVFLVGVREGQIGFEIRSLQEFMAAEALMDGADADVIARLNRIAPIAHWENVFLFAAGKCFSDRQHLRHVISDICLTLNEQSCDSDVNHITLVGSQLAVTLLLDGTARQQWNHEQALTRIACRLTDRPECDLHTRLANAYHGEVARVYKEELESKTIVESGRWAVLASLADRGLDWPIQLADKDLPTMLAREDGISVFFAEPFGSWRRARLERVMAELGPTGLEWPLFRKPELRQFLHGLSAHVLEFLQRRNEIRVPFVVDMATLGVPSLDAHHETIPQNIVLPESWRQFGDSLNFARKPSAASLAIALRSFAARGGWDIFRFWGPWPLSASLAICSTSADLEHLASQAERGELGDIQHWRDAEIRWRGQPISVNDLVAYDEHGCLIGAYMAQTGFPFLEGTLAISSPSKELVKTWHLLHHPKLRARFAQAILDEGLPLASAIGLTTEEILMMMLDITSLHSWCDMAPISGLSSPDFERPEAVRLLDAIGRVGPRFYHRANVFTATRSLFDRLPAVYAKNSNKVGLLSILAEIWPPGAELGLIYQVLPQFETSSLPIQRALLLLEAGDAGLSNSRFEILRERALALGKDRRLGLDLLEKVRMHYPITPILRSLATSLYVSGMDEEVKARAASVLDDIHRRKQSALNELAQRSSLGLPYIFAAESTGSGKARG